jgi:hypothetical protein
MHAAIEGFGVDFYSLERAVSLSSSLSNSVSSSLSSATLLIVDPVSVGWLTT